MASSSVDVEFPVHGLLPKKETGAWNFLNKYPNYNGKDVLIGIFDSGLDPGASGLQTTPTGETKVVDLFDASGAGDVDTSTVVQAKDGTITGLTGRTLQIPTNWENPTGNYHIGVKNIFSLFPKSVQNRVKKERKEKDWTKPHNELLVAAMDAKANADKATSKPTTESGKLAKAEIDSKVELLKSLDEKYEDLGPTYDCVVFHDGNTWRACVDTSETGDLSASKVMSSYREEHEYSRFTDVDMCNYAFNIYDEGNLLEIYAATGSHGTHVASIAAGYEPDSPERCGVAPGAKILGFQIADPRLGGSEETGQSLVRGILRAIEWKCDVINLSFGESLRWCADGRVPAIIEEAVTKHGILFMTSAGNSGPAISTTGAVGGCSSHFIDVGAYVSPDMMAAAYSMREKVPSNTYTFSSRGPALDGARGVDICAPGGAVASVPNCNLTKQELMNGTSMSSPNAAGCMALVLSGLKQRGIPYSTVSARRAMTNTAKAIDGADTLSEGYGLFQVDKMFDYMMEYNNQPEDWVSFGVQVGNGRGIYIREPAQLVSQQTFSITVSTKFITSDSYDEEAKTLQRKAMIDFRKSLALTCNAPWVNLPSHLELSTGDRIFSVKVDINGLSAGAHFTEILGYDVECVEKGPLVRVPITVIIPEREDQSTDYEYSWKANFSPGQVHRHFLKVPAGATAATISYESENEGLLALSLLQLLPNQGIRDVMTKRRWQSAAKAKKTLNISVRENLTLELCLAKWWSSIGQSEVEYNIRFLGVTATASPVVLHAGESVAQLDVTSMLRRQVISPSVKLTHLVQTLRPSKATLTSLNTCRDKPADGSIIYASVIEYTFKMSKAGEVNPDFSLLSSVLYESPLESQMWMLFDENKRHLLTGDAFPLRYKYCRKLTIGEYTIRLRLRHSDSKLLEKLHKTPMLLWHSLGPSAISVSVYTEQKQAIIAGRTAGAIALQPLETRPLFFRAVGDESLNKLPVSISAGMYLQGSLTLIKDTSPASLTFQHTLSDNCSLQSNENKEKPEEKDKKTEYKEAKAKLDSQWIGKLKLDDGLQLYREVRSTYGYDQLHIHLSILNALQKEISSQLTGKKSEGDEETDSKPGAQLIDYVKEFFAISSSVINDNENVNKEELIAFFGTKNDDSDNAPTRKGEMNKRKDLVEAFSLHVSVMADILIHPNDLEVTDTVSVELLQKSWRETLKFVDATDESVSKAYVKYLRANGCHSVAAMQVMKSLEGSRDKAMEQLLIQIAGESGLTHLQKYLKDNLCVKYPPSYTLH